jgi:hypothetical protein
VVKDYFRIRRGSDRAAKMADRDPPYGADPGYGLSVASVPMTGELSNSRLQGILTFRSINRMRIRHSIQERLGQMQPELRHLATRPGKFCRQVPSALSDRT